jgi:hypothetical protein
MTYTVYLKDGTYFKVHDCTSDDDAWNYCVVNYLESPVAIILDESGEEC